MAHWQAFSEVINQLHPVPESGGRMAKRKIMPTIKLTQEQMEYLKVEARVCKNYGRGYSLAQRIDEWEKRNDRPAWWTALNYEQVKDVFAGLILT